MIEQTVYLQNVYNNNAICLNTIKQFLFFSLQFNFIKKYYTNK